MTPEQDNQPVDPGAGTEPPLVTVGIPVYNGERYVREAVQSVIEQDYRQLEILISDNGSTDGTVAILEELAATDQRIRLLLNPENAGAARNFNLVLDEGRGDYTVWVASDDRIEPEYISQAVKILETRPDAIGVYSNAVRIDENGTIVGDYSDSVARARLDHPDAAVRVRDSILGFPAVVVFGVMRRDAMMKTGKHGDYIGGDRVLVMELALLGRLVRIEEALFARRVHPDAYSSISNKSAKAKWFGGSDARPGRADYIRIKKHLAAVQALSPDQRTRRHGYLTSLVLLPLMLLKHHLVNWFVKALGLLGKEIDRTKYQG